MKKYAKWYTLIFLLLVCVIVWFAVIREGRDGKLLFTTLNVGQGDALLIESPTGVQVIIDGGPNNALIKEISAVLPWYDRHIDMIVVTNPDKDHYEGFISLLQKYRVDVVLEPGTQGKTETYEILKKIITDKKIPEILARRGQIIDLGDGAYLEVLFPDRDISGLNPNDGSLVMRLVYGDTSVLLQGDSIKSIENFLIDSYGEKLESTIIKVGHHGSRTSTGEEYVKAVNPKWAIISAGKNNSYGHPHSEVLDVLEKQKIEILGTYDLGRIVFESDGLNFIQK